MNAASEYLTVQNAMLAEDMKMIYRGCTKDDLFELLPLFGQLWPDQQLSETAMKEVFINGLCSENHHYLCVEKFGRELRKQ